MSAVLLIAGDSIRALLHQRLLVALMLVNGAAVRFTMGAFSLRIDSMAVLIGCGVGFLLGFFGAIFQTALYMKTKTFSLLKTSIHKRLFTF